MRTIKFRAWHDGEMYGVDDLRFNVKGVSYAHLIQPSGRILYHTPDMGKIELMQFTGLKDRHGEEIYEDDIVMWDGGQYTVAFSEREGGWILKDDRDDWECPSLYGVSSPKQSRMVIIGNVHEPREE